MNTKIYLPLILLFAGLIFSSCDVNNEEPPIPPVIENVEIGSGNNGIGVIGRDFHFDMDVVAGELIETVQIKIEQRSDEDYSHAWSLEITWDEYQGLKNAKVHKHFDVPEDAAEGHYDFVIIVNDQNGSKLEETREVELVDPANLQADPKLYLWSIEIKDKEDGFYYVNESLENPDNVIFAQDDTLTSNVQIQNVKDDGVMYILLIKKNLNHLPETVDAIDFSKAIVFDVYEHEGENEVFTFWNTPYNSDINDFERWPELAMGAANDNNAPEPNMINGDKTWENGTYYLGVVYTNTTHQLSVHHYLEFEMEGF